MGFLGDGFEVHITLRRSSQGGSLRWKSSLCLCKDWFSTIGGLLREKGYRPEAVLQLVLRQPVPTPERPRPMHEIARCSVKGYTLWLVSIWVQVSALHDGDILKPNPTTEKLGLDRPLQRAYPRP